jgi:putative ABC transport system substrate-binding protein
MASHIERRKFLATLGAAAAWPLAARAQQQTKVPRVGWLVTGSPNSHRFSLAAFRDGLRGLGYVEGRNITIEFRWAEGDVARVPELAKDLVDQNVDVIVAGGTVVAEAAKRATSDIPIVAAGVGDLAELGLVTSLAHPGGNLTGFVASAPQTAAKRFQIMLELKPEARRAAILRHPKAPSEWAIVKEFAAANNIVVALYEPRDVEELTKALTRIPASSPDILVVLNDPFVFTYRKSIIDAAARFRIPAIYGFREFAEDGGLISYGANITDTYRRAAGYVDRIIRGTNPAELPVQLPVKFELILNSKTAKALGIEVPPMLLARADEVIE